MAVDIFKLSGSVSVDTGKAETNLRKVDATAKQTRTSLIQTEAAGKKAGQGIASGFNNSSSSAAKLGREVSELGRKLSSMKAPSLNFGGAGGSGGGFNVSSLVKGNLITSALSMATGGLTDALKQGWTAGIEYNKMLEKANISFTTLLGSTGKAQEHLKALQVFGESTPFEFPDLIKASQRMQAMGFAAADIIPTLRNVGDAVSAVGGGKDELDGVVLALGQMQTKGKVSAEEMNQLAERGIPAWDLLAKAIGKTKAETIKLSESGRLNGGRAVQGITAMMGERFGGQMDKMSGTLEGRESNFNDILQRRLGEAAKGNTEQLKNAYAKGTEGMATSAGEGFAKRLDSLLTKMGADVAPLLEKFASGEYFMQGINAINFGEKAAQSFNEGDAKGLITNGAQALGLKKGAAGEDQIAGAVADSLKSKPVFSEGIDRMLIQGITGALQKTEQAARSAGKMVGIGTGEGIETGVKDQLEMHSPSRVMEGLGKNASVSFGDGFNNGINEVINRTSDGIKKWAKAIENAGGEEFLKAVEAMAKRLKIDPNKMMNVMAFESGIDPSKKNPNSSATGLIQFMNSTAADLGTTTDKLKGMDAIGQLKYVEEYFKQFKKMADTQEAVYTAVLAGRPASSPDSVLFSKGGKSTGRAYTANAALDADKSGTITAAEAAAKAYKQGFLSAGDGAKETAGMFDQLSSALDGVKARLSSLTDSAMAFVGLGGSTPTATIPKAIQQAQTVQGGQLATSTTTAKADILTLSKDAAAATVAMSVPLKEIPTVGGAATEALKSTASQAGMFADAIMETGKATGEAIDHLSHFKDAFASGFDNMFDDILDGKKTSLKDFGKQLFKGFLSSTISSATGGKATSPGGMLSNMLFGGGASGGQSSGGGIGSAMTGGFAGGNPAQAALGGGIGGKVGGALDMAQNVGGMLGKGGALSKIPGLAKAGGFLTKLPGIGGMLGKLGGLFGMGGGGAAAGAAGAAGGTAGVGGIMGALMPGLMSNPFTAVAGIALAVGVPLLSKLFAKDPLKDYKKHIKAEYGIDASKQMLQKVFEIGQSKFGKDAPKRQIETVRLPEVRDMLSEYAGAFMKGGNNKLFDSKMFGDQFSAVNQFKVKMLHGGRVPGETRGYDHVPVLMDGGEQVISNAQQRRGGWTGKAKAEIDGMRETLASLTEVIGRLRLVQPGAVLEMGMKERPGAVMQDVRRSFDLRDEHSVAVREMVGTR